MLLILGATIFVLGTGLVVAAGRCQSAEPTIESWGGRCVVGGVALIGLAFPML
jgi:hypothetical protein